MGVGVARASEPNRKDRSKLAHLTEPAKTDPIGPTERTGPVRRVYLNQPNVNQGDPIWSEFDPTWMHPAWLNHDDITE